MEQLQFGPHEPGRDYRDRQAAFGVVARGDGQIAIARIIPRPGDTPVFDLPGGGIDPGESETDALIREFGEETGLKISAGPLICRASQRLINVDGEARNNHGAFYIGHLEAESPDLKIEDNHELVWMTPHAFVECARHEAQAWAVCAWMRRRKHIL